MDIQKQDFRTESAYQPMPSESIVEGRLSLPVEKNDIHRVLMMHGKVHANASSSDGKVYMDGEVTFNVVYLCTDGTIDFFEASSPFRHSEDMMMEGTSMHIYVKGSVKEVDYKVEDARSVYVKGIVSMKMYGMMSKTHSAVSGLDGMQVKMYDKMLDYTKEYRHDTKTIAEDIRVPQTLPRVEKILMVDAYPVVKSVKTQELKIIVEGDIKMMVMYLSEDKNAPMQHFYESIPFGEIISCENAMDTDRVMADADLYDMTMTIADEDVLRLTAKMDMNCMIMGTQQMELVKDAYSLIEPVDVKTMMMEQKPMKLWGNAKAIARANIVVPEERPAVNRVVCIKASPVILSMSPGTDRVYLEGVMMYTICYFSPDGMHSYSSDVPFEAEAQMDGMHEDYDVYVNADVEYCTFEGAGRDISVKFMMDVEMKAYMPDSFSMVTDIEEMDEPMMRKTGIIIYFADGEETIWDIAKRYKITPQMVEKYNPDIEETTTKGQKILIMG